MKKLFAALFTLVLVLVGCSSSSDTFVYGVSAPLESLDTIASSYSQTFDLFADVFIGINQVDGDANLVPGGAESVEKSEDGLTYTVKLREDGVWVDNTGAEMGSVTANDYVTAYQRMVDPNLGSKYSYIFEGIKNASDIIVGDKDVKDLGVKAVDDYTLEITLEQPTPYFESMLAFGAFVPVAADAVEQYGSDYGTSAETTWFNGPYYVTDFDPNYETTLVKNQSFFDADKVQIENITYRLNEDSSSRYNAVTNGELDFAEINSNEDYEDAKEQGIINDHLSGYSFYAVLNQADSAATSNENLRKGLSFGFDRDTLVKAAYGDINQPIEYIIPSDMTGSAYDGEEYRDYAKDSLIKYNKEEADKYFDAYMKDMGYSDRSEIHVEYLASDDSANSKLADSVQSYYNQQFGITIDLTIQPAKQMIESRKNGDFDMTVTGWGPDYADPSTYLALWQTSQIASSMNSARYSNPEYDELYVKANAEQDTEKRFSEFADLEQMLVDDGVLIPFYQKNEPFILTEGYTLPQHLFFTISHEYLTQE